jgi:hypothetical protein
MTFPTNIIAVPLKDTTKDELFSPQFYANGVDFNTIFSELLGIETQLGPTAKLDLTWSGSTLAVAGPAQTIIGGQVVSFAGDTVIFAAPGVSFVWVDEFGTLQNGISLPVNDNHLPVAQVTTGAGGAIISVLDLRPWITGTGAGGAGSFPANFRCTTSERRYARRDVAVLANTDFLPGGFIPNSDSAYFDIEILSDKNAVVTMTIFEGITPTEQILGNVVANQIKRFYRIQAPKNFDGPSVDLEYQLKFDVAATMLFGSITEIEFDALCASQALGAGLNLIPFKVPFNFATISPLVLFNLLAGDDINEVEVVIETPFDDPLATLQVGVLGDLGVVLSPTQIDPDVVGQYGTFVDRASVINENLLLTINPAGSTTGSGYVAGTIRR